MARINALSIEDLASNENPKAKQLLAEKYAGVIENVQKNCISSRFKNTDLSGDPNAGTVEANRFANATDQTYGTARTAGKGALVGSKKVTIPLDTHKEIVEEIENSDVSLLGVEGLVAKRTANHTKIMERVLDKAFFAEAVASGTEFKPVATVTDIQDVLEEAILTLEQTENAFIDGIDRDLMHIVADVQTYSKVRKYVQDHRNGTMTTADESVLKFNGVVIEDSNHLPAGTQFILEMKESIAQPVRSTPYSAERIPMSNAVALELFYTYGTKAVTPETILYYKGNHAE